MGWMSVSGDADYGQAFSAKAEPSGAKKPSKVASARPSIFEGKTFGMDGGSSRFEHLLTKK